MGRFLSTPTWDVTRRKSKSRKKVRGRAVFFGSFLNATYTVKGGGVKEYKTSY